MAKETNKETRVISNSTETIVFERTKDFHLK